jgi:cell wall-associated NlpC family hydrolase
LRPGDLVFFKNTYKAGISHVGIYIGEGRFIHAASTRTGVRVDTLDKPYYVNHYAGARRPQ